MAEKHFNDSSSQGSSSQKTLQDWLNRRLSPSTDPPQSPNYSRKFHQHSSINPKHQNQLAPLTSTPDCQMVANAKVNTAKIPGRGNAQLTSEFWNTVMDRSQSSTFRSATPRHRSSSCVKCGASFKRKYDLFQHDSAVHRKERPFACSGCMSKFAHKGTLSKHIRTVHRKEKPYVCENCGLKFSERGNVNKHKLRAKACKLSDSRS